MKKSELKQIIREEYKKVLSEMSINARTFDIRGDKLLIYLKDNTKTEDAVTWANRLNPDAKAKVVNNGLISVNIAAAAKYYIQNIF